MTAALERRYPLLLALAVVCGLAAANLARIESRSVAVASIAAALAAAPLPAWRDRLGVVCLALALAGWWWGSVRLDHIDRSPLTGFIGHAGPARVETTAPSRRSQFALRVLARMRVFDGERIDEPILLELPLGRAPPQGAVLALVARLESPRGPVDGFDERSWLRRQGIHVVAKAHDWRIVGHRHGVGGVADRLHSWLAGSVAAGLHGERAAVVEGVLLGEDQGLSDDLRASFRASGVYHLLAVSGQNVAFVAGGALLLAWALGIPRWLGEIGALCGIGAYVLAVGAQPSVVRAGIAGGLTSLAWLTSRPRDRWHFLALGAIALLAWNPYTVRDAGFQLSFVAVAAIFVGVSRVVRRLEGYPLPRKLREVIAVSLACGAATAPILWLQFGAVPVYSVLANAAVEPAVVPLLALALASAVAHTVSPPAAVAIAWLNGWLAAFIATCARAVAGLPFARVSSGAGVLGLSAVCLLAAAVVVAPRGR